MKEAQSVRQVRELLGPVRGLGRRIGLVPTMGALHPGHLSLVQAIRPHCDSCVVSIFVNPTQFAAHEDLGSYPRTLDSDLEQLRAAGVDLAFVPTIEEMYPAGATTMVQPPAVARALEGEIRPTHFQGVATIVLKLFNIVQPEIACFGQKDYQQALVVRQMVADLDLPIQILIAPTVREPDGLALSSRNRYLKAEQRQVATALSRALRWVEREIQQGVSDGAELRNGMNQILLDAGVDRVDYAVVCDPQTLEIRDPVRPPVVALVAARVGTTRLIDNWLVN